MAASYSSFPISSSAPAITNTKHSLPRLPPLHLSRLRSATLYRRTGMNVTVMSTRGSTKESGEGTSGLPEIVTNVQQAWSNVDDKLAVASLGVALIVALWASTGLIYAIDKLPVLPGVLELVGIVYTGWFVYTNLIFQPDREALTEKIKTTFKDIIGPS